jgi:hypothetical protein
MGAFVKRGGYVVTTPDKKYVSNSEVDQPTLKKIAEVLGMKPDEREKLRVITSIWIDASDKS